MNILCEKNHIAILDAYKQQIAIVEISTGKVKNIIENVGHADGIQIDIENNYIYWTDMGPERNGEDFLEPDGAIYRCKFDGREKQKLIGNGLFYTPKQLQLDIETQQLYWCDREGGRVFRSKTDGTNVEVLIDRSANDIFPVDQLDQCVGIVLNKKSGHFYWTQKGPSKAGLGRIFRANIKFPTNETGSNRKDILTLLDHLPEPIDLELDVEKQILYWTDRGAEPNGNSLNCAKITSTGLIDHQIIVHGFKEAIGLSLDQDCIFVSDLSGTVYKIELKTKSKHIIYSSGTMCTGIQVF